MKENSSEKFSGTEDIDETYVGGKNKNRHANKKHQYSQGTIDKAMVVGKYFAKSTACQLGIAARYALKFKKQKVAYTASR